MQLSALLCELINTSLKVDYQAYPKVFNHLTETIQDELPLIDLFYDEKTRLALRDEITSIGKLTNTIFIDQKSNVLNCTYSEVFESINYRKFNLHKAVADSNKNLLVLFLFYDALFQIKFPEKDSILSIKDSQGNNALFQALNFYSRSQEAKEIFKILLNLAPSSLLLELDGQDYTILYQALIQNNKEGVEIIISKLETLDENVLHNFLTNSIHDGQGPIAYALATQNFDIAHMLLNLKILPAEIFQSQTSPENNILTIALSLHSEEHARIVKKIVSQKNIDIDSLNFMDGNNGKILHKIFEFKFSDNMISKLLSDAANIILLRNPKSELLSHQNNQGDTPLHLAIRNQYYNFISAFLNTNQINIDSLGIENNKGDTPFDLALEHNLAIATKILKKLPNNHILLGTCNVNENTLLYHFIKNITQRFPGVLYLDSDMIMDRDAMHLIDAYNDMTKVLLSKIAASQTFESLYTDETHSRERLVNVIPKNRSLLQLLEKTFKELSTSPYNIDEYIDEYHVTNLKINIINLINQLLELGAQPCEVNPIKKYMFFTGQTNKAYFKELETLIRYKKAYDQIGKQYNVTNFILIREIFLKEVHKNSKNYDQSNLPSAIDIYENPNPNQKNSSFTPRR